MDVPHISKPILAFFRRIVHGYFRRSFTAVRLMAAPEPAAAASERLIVYANHGSWWDPMVCVLLAEKLMPGRRHYAPMDAEALSRYAILRQIGIFGVDTGSARGAVKFLRTGQALVEAGGVVWVTPQGRFVDARERPLRFKPGLAALASRVGGGCTVLPLAIEYVFWDERLPEVLLHFGEPVRVQGQEAAEVEKQMETALLQAMEELKVAAMARDPAAFKVLARGRAGTGGFYGLGQRLLALLRGRTYQPEHTRHPGAAREERL